MLPPFVILEGELMSSAQQYAVTLPGWGCDLTVILTSDGPYFLVRQLCGVLGLSSTRQQIDRIRERSVLHKYLAQFPVQTRGGRQLAWCLHRRAVGFWLGTIQDSRVRPEIQPRILELQEDLLTAADRLIWGEIDVTPAQQTSLQIEGQLADLRTFSLKLEERVGRLEQGVSLPEDDNDG